MDSNTKSNDKRYRIAFITPSNPIDADSGGKQFTLERLLGLSALGDIDIFCLQDSADQRNRLSCILSGRPVFSAGTLKPRTAVNWIQSIIARLPLSVWRNDLPELSQLIDLHAAPAYDAIYVDHWLMWPASLKFNSKSRRILNLHNAEHLIFERTSKNQKGIMRSLLQFEALRVRQYLLKISLKADLIHAISEVDRAELVNIGIPDARITTILPCVDLKAPPSGRRQGRILFAGTLSWAPNAEGLEWFLRAVLPGLETAQPVQVVGGEPPSSWQQLPSIHKVEFLGRVPSVEPLYAEAGVVIAPVFSGSGIKLKIVNALARGLPVVTTTCGIEGFPAGWEGAVRVCDDPLRFGQAITAILDDTDGWAIASRHAINYAALHFSTDAAKSKLEACLNVDVTP